jgi:CTP synthase
MGNYERFLNTSLSRENYMTTGSIYLKVIQDERALKYRGKTVSVVPDIPLAVIDQIERAGKKEKADVVIVEIGGTLGEYQNILFIEAFRMMKMKNPKDVISVLVSYLPIPNKVGEMKSKPTQNAVKTMRETGGFSPDIIVGRSEKEIDEKRKEKIAFYSNIEKEAIISAPDIDSIYDLPKKFLEQNLDKIILKKLHIRGARKNSQEIKK